MIKERWYIALLRGINISGKNKVPMANLKKSFEALGWSHLPVNARFTGFCVGMMGDVIFLLSVLCIKDSCRASIPDKDKTELVTIGIYRFSRTPAFLCFDLMYVGALLLYGNLLTLPFWMKSTQALRSEHPVLRCWLCRRRSSCWTAPGVKMWRLLGAAIR